MSRKPCPFANEQCKYWNRPAPPELKREQDHGCFADHDHIVPQRLGTTALAACYIKQHPENQQQLCRELHDAKTSNGDAPLPSDEYMLRRITEAEALGHITLSQTQRRKILGDALVLRIDAASERMDADTGEAGEYTLRDAESA